MANTVNDLDEIVENLKATVRKSFACMYASIKARELKTLRQLDAIWKQCQNNKDLQRNCVQNIKICFNNESTLIENISKYGEIDLERLSFDNNTFICEDYISPSDDHMYLYKTIDELTKEEDIKEVEAIEEAALKQITETDDCVCIVTVQSEEVSKKFRNVNVKSPLPESPSRNNNDNDLSLITSTNTIPMDCKSSDSTSNNLETEEEKSECSDGEIKKINPTDDWLKSIKNQPETEPSQVTDVMEHSTFVCS